MLSSFAAFESSSVSIGPEKPHLLNGQLRYVNACMYNSATWLYRPNYFKLYVYIKDVRANCFRAHT